MKVKIETYRSKLFQSLVRDVELTKEDIFAIIRKNKGDLSKIVLEEEFKDTFIESSELPNDWIVPLEVNFYDKIVMQDLYVGVFSYGEWKDESSYYLGGYVLLIGVKEGDQYNYKFLHQRYYEDELDKYGSFMLIDGHTNYFRTNMKQKMRKKPMLVPVFSSDVLSLLDHFEEIHSIKDVKEILEKNIE